MAQKKAKTDAARKAAVLALVRVHKGAYAGLALAGGQLAPRDKAFAAALFYGSVERICTLDYLLTPHLKKPVEKLDTEVRAILECGLYQMLYMRVPQSAAVNQSVNLARAVGKSSAAGLVNAVLRKMQEFVPKENAPPGLNFANFKFESELLRVSVVHSVGKAVANAVMQALPTEYDDFFAASFSSGQVCLRCNTLKINQDQLLDLFKQRQIKAQKGQLPGAIYAFIPGGVAEDELFLQGLYHVQGEASQYVCANMDAQKGQKVLDLCAAPGGKTATMAQDMGSGKGLTSCDVSESRLPLIKEALKRLGIFGATVLCNNAAQYNSLLQSQDKVLCDVPCSGLGVLAQKPDLRYTKGQGFEDLPDLQLNILQMAARYVKKGGILLYSTCTIRQQENQMVVGKFLENNREFALCPPRHVPKGALLQDDMMTILPHKTGMDGFFMAKFVRL